MAEKITRQHLPIDDYEKEILSSFLQNEVTIIIAGTGAGKSTRVPQMILNNTDYSILATQPRRLPTETVSQRVAYEMGVRFGGLVGFRTAERGNDSKETRCLFTTDGLQLVRELMHAKQTTSMSEMMALIIDEIHEWNINMEVLVAWCREELKKRLFKLMIMTATEDGEKLADYFRAAGLRVRVITVPGRVFPVIGSPMHEDGIRQVPEKAMVDEVLAAIASGENSLVFLPGKKEIADMRKQLEDRRVNAQILDLHADLTSEQQALAFRSFAIPKVILSTNIAQTSVTIPDIGWVIDSGYERRIELRNHVETLTLANIAKADVIQRAGRAGRVQAGNYVLCNDTDHSTFAEYPVAEMHRRLLDQVVLKLLGVGIDATLLKFFHQPDIQVLIEAKKTLYAVGAITQEGAITELGKTVNRFPVGVKMARMIIRGIEAKCLGSVMIIAAIMETSYSTIKRNQRADDPAGYKSWTTVVDPFGRRFKSDLILELELFLRAREMNVNSLERNGISKKGFGKAMEVLLQLKDLMRSMGYGNEKEYNANSYDDAAIQKCILSGMVNQLYSRTRYNIFDGGDGVLRSLAKESVVQGTGEWIVATPKNIEPKGRQTVYIVTQCTEVSFDWILELAPHLVQRETISLSFGITGYVMESVRLTINGRSYNLYNTKAEWSPENHQVFCQGVMDGSYVSNSWLMDSVNELKAAYDMAFNDNLVMSAAAFKSAFMAAMEGCKIVSIEVLEGVWDEVAGKIKENLTELSRVA